MTAPIDNPTFAAGFAGELAPLVPQLAAGTITQAQFIAALSPQLASLLNSWNVQLSTAQFIQQMQALFTSFQAIANSFAAVSWKGTVATVTALPSASTGIPGDRWIALDTGVLYILVAGATPYWQPLGPFMGPAAWSAPKAWTTGTAFVAGPPASVVTTGGSAYVCLVPHTSGVFATDLAAGKWQLVASVGTAATVGVGTVTMGAAGSAVAVTNSGSSSAAVLNFTIPAGAAATVGVGTVTMGAAGSAVAVTNSGSSSAAVLNFTIPAGAAATVGVGTVTTGAAGSAVAVTNSGSSSAAVLNFTIPAGAAATVGVGTVTTGATGSAATVTNSGTSAAAVLNFSIPAGAAATVGVGTVTTGAAGSSATVTNSGTSAAAVLNFSIPAGAAATVGVGTVTTGAAGSSATVTNSGTSAAAVLNFSIPAGAAATVGVGTVTTGAAGSSAAVTNSGTAAAAVLNFSIPRGPAAWSPPAAWATGTAYAPGPPASTVFINGNSYVCLVAHTSGTFATDLANGDWQIVAQAGTNGTGAGNVNSTGTIVANHVAVYSDTTGNSIKDGGYAIGTGPGQIPPLGSDGKLQALDASKLINLPASATPYTVTGAVTAGQLLAQRSDGTLEPISGTVYSATAGAAAAYAGSIGSPNYYGQLTPWTFYDAPNDCMVTFFSDGYGYLYANKGTVSGSSATQVTWGTPVALVSSNVVSNGFSASYDATNARYFICTTGGSIYAVKLSGSSFTIGSPINLASYYGTSPCAAVWNPDQSVGVLAFFYGGSVYLTCFTGTGTALTFVNNPVSTASGNGSYGGIALGYDTTNKVVVCFSVANASSQCSVSLVSVTGTTITVITYSTKSTAASASLVFNLVWLPGLSLFFGYDASGYGSIVGYSGGALVFTTPTLTPTATSSFTKFAASYDSTRGQLVVAGQDSGNSNYLTTALYSFSASGFSLVSGSGLVVASSSSYWPGSIPALPAKYAYKAVLTTLSNLSGYPAYSYLVEPSNITVSNAANYVGVAAASAASGATTTLQPLNGLLTGQSGLTPNADYYASPTGGLTTSATYPKVGKALTATSVIITGLAA